MLKKTVVLGASPNPMRFSYKMTRSLVRHNIEVVPVGFRKGSIEGVDILTGTPHIDKVHTVTLYLGPDRQDIFYSYILSLYPRRIIFNPGTYNPDLARLARANGIETVIDCGLVMLNKGTY
jgi:predicted CoA-binding protein